MMYYGHFEGYVKDDDGRCIRFEVECEKIRREDCVLIHNALLKSPDIHLCGVSITESQDAEEVVCDTCGHKIVFKTAVGPVASSEYIGTTTCRSCQMEYCRTMNCLGCKIGNYSDCQFLYLKKLAVIDDEEG